MAAVANSSVSSRTCSLMVRKVFAPFSEKLFNCSCRRATPPIRSSMASLSLRRAETKGDCPPSPHSEAKVEETTAPDDMSTAKTATENPNNRWKSHDHGWNSYPNKRVLLLPRCSSGSPLLVAIDCCLTRLTNHMQRCPNDSDTLTQTQC
jgi:hypothetical protein